MNGIGSAAGVAYRLQPQGHQYRGATEVQVEQKEKSQDVSQLQKADGTKKVELSTDNPLLSKDLDLTRIAPEDAYGLAAELYDKGDIDVYQLASIFIAGANHQLPPGPGGFAAGTPEPNNDPFNLLAALSQNVIRGEKSDPASDTIGQDRRIELLDLLTRYQHEANEARETKEAIVEIKV